MNDEHTRIREHEQEETGQLSVTKHAFELDRSLSSSELPGHLRL